MSSSPRKKSNNNSQSELKREASFRGASAAPSGQRKKKKSGVSSSEKNTVQSLAKGFRVLETFTAQEPELTMAEVARLAGIDNATAFRFLNTLVEIGYVDRVADSRKFRLALKVLDLGFNAIARSDLRARARPICGGWSARSMRRPRSACWMALMFFISNACRRGLPGLASISGLAAVSRHTHRPSVTPSWPGCPGPIRSPFCNRSRASN